MRKLAPYTENSFDFRYKFFWYWQEKARKRVFGIYTENDDGVSASENVENFVPVTVKHTHSTTAQYSI